MQRVFAGHSHRRMVAVTTGDDVYLFTQQAFWALP